MSWHIGARRLLITFRASEHRRGNSTKEGDFVDQVSKVPHTKSEENDSTDQIERRGGGLGVGGVLRESPRQGY